MNKKALCFVFDQNYVNQGKHAILSAKKYNPNHTTILLTDYKKEKISDIQLSPKDIDLPNDHWLLVGRIALVEFVIKNLEYNTAIFIDGDTYSYNSFDDLQSETENHSLVVLPHITEPLPEDNFFPQNRTISFAGNYNTGVWSASEKGLSFISWWKNQTQKYPVTMPEVGLIAEQGWLRFAPDFNDNIKIFRHPGYNVAYWNIKQRFIEKKENTYLINNEKLCIMHFSGLNKDINPINMSKFQNRFILDSNDIVFELYNSYYNLIWNTI